MRTYEDMAYVDDGNRQTTIQEVYSGESIVAWHGNIERQLLKFVNQYEAAKNQSYVAKLNALLTTWRANPFSGSINVETTNALLSAVGILAVDSWQLQNYFSNLRDSLRQLQASEEELPRVMEPGPKLSRKPSRASLDKALPSDYGPENDKLKQPPTAVQPEQI